MNKDMIKKAITRQRVIAAVLLIVFLPSAVFDLLIALAGLATISEPFDVAMTFLFMLLTLICLLMIKNALTRLSVVRHYPSYSARLSYGTTSVRQLSVALGHSPAKVIKNVKKMIAYALLPGCYYDSHMGCVVMPGIPVSTPTPPGAYTVVRCDSCGAKNKVAVGQVIRCEFCGTKIKG